jgi:hypothetical protein
MSSRVRASSASCALASSVAALLAGVGVLPLSIRISASYASSKDGSGGAALGPTLPPENPPPAAGFAPKTACIQADGEECYKEATGHAESTHEAPEDAGVMHRAVARQIGLVRKRQDQSETLPVGGDTRMDV